MILPHHANLGRMEFSETTAGRGDSQEPQHVAIQTRQDVGSLYASTVITNGLLAAILAALLVR